MNAVVLRGAAAVMLSLCGYLMGRSFFNAALRRGRALNALITGVRALSARMLTRLMPVAQALDGECTLFADVSRAMRKDGLAPDAAWRAVREEAIRRGKALDCLVEEDMRALDGLFASLGSGVPQEQKRLLDDAEEVLTACMRRAAQDAESCARLYGKLGALAGAALAIALI